MRALETLGFALEHYVYVDVCVCVCVYVCLRVYVYVCVCVCMCVYVCVDLTCFDVTCFVNVWMWGFVYTSVNRRLHDKISTLHEQPSKVWRRLTCGMIVVPRRRTFGKFSKNFWFMGTC